MTNAFLGKELHIKTPNEVGMMAKVTGTISQSGVGICALCACGEGKDATFHIVTKDNATAANALKKGGFTATEKEVIIVEVEDKVGAGNMVASKISGAGININYCYATSGDGNALLVLSTNNNARAVKAIS